MKFATPHHTPRVVIPIVLSLLIGWSSHQLCAQGGWPERLASYRAAQYSDEYFRQTQLETDWLEREAAAFKRLDFHLGRDEYKARKERERLEEQRGNLLTFVNGMSRPWTQASFRKSIQQIEQTPNMKQLLQSRVPSLEVGEFRPNNTAYQLLSADGRLTRPPVVLASGTSASGNSLKELARQVGLRWLSIRQELAQGQGTSLDQMRELRGAYERWDTESTPLVLQASTNERLRGKHYLAACQRLVNLVEDPGRHAELATYVRHGGFRFAGGTFADLINHVLQHDVSMQYGGRGQLALSELAHDMLRDLDEQIAVSDNRIEHYKAQNPAHTAALKQRSLSEDQLIRSLAAAGNPTTMIVATPYGPMTLVPEFAPSTVARDGLGSSAFGQGLPQPQSLVSPVRPVTAAWLPFRTPADAVKSNSAPRVANVGW